MGAAQEHLNVLVLAGDGIGPEVTAESLKVLELVCKRSEITLTTEHGDFGGASIDKHGEPITKDVLDRSRKADAVLLGACGGPKWDNLPTHQRPEKGLLALREHMEVFANLRPGVFSRRSPKGPSRPPRQQLRVIVVRELVRRPLLRKPRSSRARRASAAA